MPNIQRTARLGRTRCSRIVTPRSGAARRSPRRSGSRTQRSSDTWIYSPDRSSCVSFWSTHAGAELDFVWKRGHRLVGFEAKWRDAPAMTRSMHVALADLGLEALYVVYPGPKRYALAKRVEVPPIADLGSVLPMRS